MFEEGTIIYFDPFYFKNGNAAKSKYFIVLKNTENNSILASLPTRKDSIPTQHLIEQGCVELPDINFNCFVFSPNSKITTCQKSFDFPTHVYGYQIDLYKTDYLQEIYPIEGTDYTVWGKMKKDIFNDLMDCLKTSKTVKRKFIKILS